MGRSLISLLRRRRGATTASVGALARAKAERENLAKHLPLALFTHAFRPPDRRTPPSVAVIGGGFAGLAAATVLRNLQFRVTVYEARAKVGGRVESVTDLVDGRILERGAELIGGNHPAWMYLAAAHGLGLTVMTTEEDFELANLHCPVRMQGRAIEGTELERLTTTLDTAAEYFARDAKEAFPSIENALTPWTSRQARRDQETLGSWIKKFSQGRDPLVPIALDFEFGNHNASEPAKTSLLGQLAQVAGGDGLNYWEHTEVFRCAEGNAALATHLANELTRSPSTAKVLVNQMVAKVTLDGDQVTVSSQRTPPPGSTSTSFTATSYDYVVLAVPPTVYRHITLPGPLAEIPQIQCGPAVKYLAPVKRRYWIQALAPKKRGEGLAPSGISDELGQTWEGTDNQTGNDRIDLSVFAGGRWAAIGGDPSSHFDARIEKLLPGFEGDGGVTGRPAYANWPAERFIETGYSCPAPGEVTTKLKRMQQAFGDRVFLAGEHCSPAFFGFMEGALQSGLFAACRVAVAAAIKVPMEYGNIKDPAIVVK